MDKSIETKTKPKNHPDRGKGQERLLALEERDDLVRE